MAHSTRFQVDLRSPGDGAPNLDGYDVAALVDAFHRVAGGRQTQFLRDVCEKLPASTQLLLHIDASCPPGTAANQFQDLIL